MFDYLYSFIYDLFLKFNVQASEYTTFEPFVLFTCVLITLLILYGFFKLFCHFLYYLFMR